MFPRNILVFNLFFLKPTPTLTKQNFARPQTFFKQETQKKAEKHGVFPN